MKSPHDDRESTEPLLSAAMDTEGSVIVASSPPLTATDMDDHSERNIPPPAYNASFQRPQAAASAPSHPIGYMPPPRMSLLSQPADETRKSALTPIAVNCCGHTDNFSHACGVVNSCSSASRVRRACCGINACGSESLLRQAGCGLNLCGSHSLLEKACCGVNCCGSHSKLAASCVTVDLCGSSSLLGKTICAVQCCDPQEEEEP